MLYKRYRSTFDEILFVVSGSTAETTADTCQYENVLCIQYEELQFSNQRTMEIVVNDMTNKIRARFEVCLLFAFVLSSTDVLISITSFFPHLVLLRTRFFWK